MGEESSICVATVDDSTSSEECKRTRSASTVASILDVLRANRKRKVLSKILIVVAEANADTRRLSRAQSRGESPSSSIPKLLLCSNIISVNIPLSFCYSFLYK